MSKILMIIAQSGFRDEELFVPKEILEKAGHSVKVASMTRQKAVGSRGATLTPDMAVYEANPEFFDCIVVVGGPGSPALSESPEVRELLLGAEGKGKLLGAICLGPMALAKAGILTGKKATIFPDKSAIALLRETGAYYKAEPIVEDGRTVTADSPASAAKFGEKLVALLKK
jgi:protease I